MMDLEVAYPIGIRLPSASSAIRAPRPSARPASAHRRSALSRGAARRLPAFLQTGQGAAWVTLDTGRPTQKTAGKSLFNCRFPLTYARRLHAVGLIRDITGASAGKSNWPSPETLGAIQPPARRATVRPRKMASSMKWPTGQERFSWPNEPQIRNPHERRSSHDRPFARDTGLDEGPAALWRDSCAKAPNRSWLSSTNPGLFGRWRWGKTQVRDAGVRPAAHWLDDFGAMLACAPRKRALNSSPLPRRDVSIAPLRRSGTVAPGAH